VPGALLPHTGALARSAAPERVDKAISAADRWARAWALRVRHLVAPSAARETGVVRQRMAREATELAALTDAQVRARIRAMASPTVQTLRRADLHAALLAVAEAARRSLGLTPYPVQLVGAATLLRGRLAEMQTGEGKTLTAGLAACLAAAAGVPTHVITVNDYLAHRDAKELGPLFAFVGASVGVVSHDMTPDAKRRSYACDITYCTNKDLVFDYLRDRVEARGRASAAQLGVRRLLAGSGSQPLLRGLHFAIVDEADSILIDEARTPLILAERDGAIADADHYASALELARTLRSGRDYLLDAVRCELHLTLDGRVAAAAACAGRGAPWSSEQTREFLLIQALRSLHLFDRDRHYLIDVEGQVQIIDEYTGRVLPGRTGEQGLHQMIEAKEGCVFSEQTRPLARITYQRFFARYLRLAGMTGTAREVAPELRRVYGLDTASVPTHRRGRRRRLPDRVCAEQDAKWQAIADTAAYLRARGQPVLIGTRSVAASERLSRVLDDMGLPHAVLNARQDAEESEIVADAGQAGSITVATNMAGRGTDIRLGPGVAELGGLFVILTEYHESPRIDRQLFGRCARQGDPGDCQAIVGVDDELLVQHAGALGWLMRRLGLQSGLAGRLAARCGVHLAQRRAEHIHAGERRETLRQDHSLDQMLAFSGEPI
jgi:preprotein translocase subunit SecA